METTSNGNIKPMGGRGDVTSAEVHLEEDEIAGLAADVGSRWKLFALASIPNPPPIYEPICEYTTVQACREVNPECIYLLCSVPRTIIIINIKKAVNNAACPQAFHKEQEEERNAIPRLDHHTRQRILAPEALNSSRCLESQEVQWLNMDVRDMDAATLGSFDLILADPPWDIHMTLPYGTLSDDDLRALPIPSLQPTWGLLALWVTGRAMELARELFKAWGYRRIDEVCRFKPSDEPFFRSFGSKSGSWEVWYEQEEPDIGSNYLKRGVDGDVVVAEGRETSRKPDEFYGILERLVLILCFRAERPILRMELTFFSQHR
ncbi:hypothetical protein QFC21_004528 [Naganishia friedmannii]|uniref:Uncharacterized protein n=1 Tax=Naganishia friedmannii TaxID=89922 RepID=A0ACC2VFL5_9TREE|nr:hypothetical protein QFC21_004528 [Naganishia friedmannii]